MLKTICVFCASSSKVDTAFLEASRELADVCVDNGIHALYGGGAVGLMGAFANRMIERKGQITGIIPHFMRELEWAHADVPEMVFVDDMRERKKRLIENVDAVVALPGGIGTMEELFEVSTLKQLGKFDKPIVIVNTNGFYNTLLNFINELVDKQFMHSHNRSMWMVLPTPKELIHVLNQPVLWDATLINKGAM
jgi:uncharacterized protein (TIGR00730 family)